MKISMMAAMGENRVIGNDGEVPWNMPADIAHFHRVSDGKPYIMGRKSYEAPDVMLSSEKNIILSRQSGLDLEGNCIQAESIQEAIEKLEGYEEVFIMGGAGIYEQALDFANYIYLTIIHGHFEGDAHFPVIPAEAWGNVKSEKHSADQENPYDYSFLEFERKV